MHGATGYCNENLFADFYFIQHSPWCRIAADIKVKVKHARRLQGIVM